MVNKIYGYDENLWYDIIKSNYWTGDRDIDFIDMILKRKGKFRHIIDLGCGVGRISNRLAARGYMITGIDLSRKCVEEAKKIAENLRLMNNIDYIVGDYRTLFFSKVEFDAAICILASTWKNLDEMKLFLKNLKDKIREGGIFLLVDIVKEKLLISLFSAPSIQRWFNFNDDILLLHTWKYNLTTSMLKTEKEFYKKCGSKLNYITKVEREYPIYSIDDYLKTISIEWKVEEIYDPPLNLMSLDSFNDPWWAFSLMIVARKI